MTEVRERPESEVTEEMVEAGARYAEAMIGGLTTVSVIYEEFARELLSLSLGKCDPFELPDKAPQRAQ